MKTILGFSLLLLLATTAWGEDCCGDASPHIVIMNGQAYESEKQYIESIAESGKICEVYGHWWGDVELECIEGYRIGCVNHEKSIERICKLCHKKQKWVEDWQDD